MPSRPKRWKYRILYVGSDLALTAFLKDVLNRLDCFVVRSPDARLSYCLIESEMPYIGGSAIKYSLFLFDEVLLDMTGKELEKFTHTIKHRKKTPVIIYQKSDDFNKLVETIIRLLDASGCG